MPQECRVCAAPLIIKNLIERLRTAGVSHRDVEGALKAIKDYDISYMSVQRHEINGHFSPEAVLSASIPMISVGDLTLRTIVDHKLKIWWSINKDIVPNTKEMQDWMKLAAQYAQADKAIAEAQALRAGFMKPAKIIEALPTGEDDG